MRNFFPRDEDWSLIGSALGIVLAVLLVFLVDFFVRSDPVPLVEKHMRGVRDEVLFACACPGAVSFCREWKEKWAWQAAPEVRNQTVRECVIDFMSSVTGKPWPPEVGE